MVFRELFRDYCISLESGSQSETYGRHMSAAAWENLYRATLELAKSSTLKQRLTDAFSRHLQDMPAADMPDELRADFETLCKRMTQVCPMRGETAVGATVRKMSIDEADACAVRIVALLDALHRTQAPDAASAANHTANGHGNAQNSGPTRIGPEAASRIPTLISINRA
jgi:hypothetical protein